MGVPRNGKEAADAPYLRRDRERCVGIKLVTLRGTKAATYFRLSLSHSLLGFWVLCLRSRVKLGKDRLDLWEPIDAGKEGQLMQTSR